MCFRSLPKADFVLICSTQSGKKKEKRRGEEKKREREKRRSHRVGPGYIRDTLCGVNDDSNNLDRKPDSGSSPKQRKKVEKKKRGGRDSRNGLSTLLSIPKRGRLSGSWNVVVDVKIREEGGRGESDVVDRRDRHIFTMLHRLLLLSIAME